MKTQLSNSILFLSLLLLVIISSCSEDDTGIDKTNDTTDITGQVIENPEYEPTQLSEDTTELFDERGNKESDTVWIYEQGGPHENFGRIAMDNLPNHNNYHKILVQQAQIYNSSLYHTTLSNNELMSELDISVEMLHRVINYFKSRGKTLIVIGHSFGSWLIMRYLAKHDSQSIDKLVLSGCRINIEISIANALINRQVYYYPNGNPPPIHDPDQQLSQFMDPIESRLAAMIFVDRYAEKLSDVALSNTMFACSIDDIRVGRLNQSEIDFLISKDVTVLQTDGGHPGMWDNPAWVKKIYEFITSDSN